MKTQCFVWADGLEDWVELSIPESENYFKLKVPQADLNTKGDRIMEMEVHNQLDINFEKSLNTIAFFSKAKLGKFPQNQDWKLEVWLDDEKSGTRKLPNISCGVALKRPKQNILYAKKDGPNLNHAVKHCFGAIERSLRQEAPWWSKAS